MQSECINWAAHLNLVAHSMGLGLPGLTHSWVTGPIRITHLALGSTHPGWCWAGLCFKDHV
ncbi:hypothetical protein HanRHA438_Chr06g0267421 [Helianthus annuus]|nr:hypothetical protein HanRHA438_Chr06g0267421 [Helianthus annuus]